MQAQNITKKIISPFIYSFILFPFLMVTTIIMITVEQTIVFLFDKNGFVELPIIIFTLGTFLFWSINNFFLK